MSSVKVRKEFLSTILGYNVLTDGHYLNSTNIAWGMIGCTAIDDCEEYEEEMNIYELVDKITDWIEDQGYWIKKSDRNIYELHYLGKEVYCIDTLKRINAPLYCAQWIIDNKEDK